MNFKIGDTIKVNDGISDPDTGKDISGFQGRVTKLDHPYVRFTWDSISLQTMGQDVADYYEERGYDWRVMGLSLEDISHGEERDSIEDVKQVIAELEKYQVYIGLDNAEEIAETLKGIDPESTMELETRWYEYLDKTLRLPVKAEIFEGYSRGEFKVGHKVTIIELDEIDRDYGILVKIENKESEGYRPLCDLKVLNKKLKNYKAIASYTDWFVNGRTS